MLDVSVLYAGLETVSTPHRYGRPITQIDPPDFQKMKVAKNARDRRPIVVWNLTRTCNLNCVHCYTDSACEKYPGELSTDECKAVLDDLAAFKVPAVLFSGGEPLVRKDIFELAAYARSLGLHVVLSTNGTLLLKETAQKLKNLEFSYVGISLDSADSEIHDHFRGSKGAFDRTMRGFKNCVDVGQKVGLRLTLTRQTCKDLDKIFDFIEDNGINRACFYHLVPAGRGISLGALTHEESRQAIDTIFTRTKDMIDRGIPVEILTVDNHCDGPYLYERMLREGHTRAEQVLDMLKFNGGGLYSSGVGVANIDFHGNIHADQFSMFRTFANVKDRKFSEVWLDPKVEVLKDLKNRIEKLEGRCKNCRFKTICGGALRARAETVTGNPWDPDPGCYLTDDEICGEPIELSLRGQKIEIEID